MSAVPDTGSASCRSTDSGATGRRGDSASSSRPSAWSRRMRSSLPKRRASGARGAAITAPAVRRPTLSRLAQVAGSSRNADSGNGPISPASCPGSTIVAPEKRAAAQAAPAVEASPARTSKPWWKKRARMSSSRRFSPPNRCTQPVMSRNRPAWPSSATSGV